MDKPDPSDSPDKQLHFQFGLRVFCNACDEVHTIYAEAGDIVRMPCCIGEVRKIDGYFASSKRAPFQIYRTIIGSGIGAYLHPTRWHHPSCPCAAWNMHPKDPIDPNLQKIIKKFEGRILTTPYLEDGT